MHITAIYPGTFDPITNGHVDLVHRCSKIFHKIIVAVAPNPGKSPFFTVDERASLAAEVLNKLGNVEVLPFTGLLVDFARSQGATVILRGLRAVSDFEYEVQLAGLNRTLSSDAETLFISAAHQYQFLSSSMVREIASLGGDVSEFVDPLVLGAIDRRLN
jgi:pantetheine-phosphate adenylyltransferase